MAAECHNLVRLLRTHQVSKHIGARRIRLHMRLHIEVNLDPGRLFRQARKELCIFNGHSRRRNLRLSSVINGHAGMWRLHGERRNRTHQHRNCAQRSSPRRPRNPIRHRLPVADIRRIEQDDLPRHTCLAQSIELIEIRDHNHRRVQTADRRRNTQPQAQHMQRLRYRGRNRRRLMPPHPVWHHHRLHGDVLQPLLAHQVRTPSDGAIQRLAARDALADVVTEIRQVVVPHLVGGRSSDQLLGLGAIRLV